MTTSTKRLRAVIYNRCSTEKEVQENAIITQSEESLAVCAEKGWIVVDQYKEMITGKFSDIRPMYTELYKDLTTDKFDIIVVKSQDRLMRNTLDWAKFVDRLIEFNKRLYLYMDNKFYEPDEDEELYGFKMQFHAMYCKELGKKIKLSHKTRQKNLKHPNITRPPFGWDRIDKNTFVINEREAELYRIAFEKVREGKGFHVIANEMYELGARGKNTGDKISSTGWRQMVYSPRAHGTVIMNNEVIVNTKRKSMRVKNPESEWIYFENALPAIVSKEYQDEIISLHQQRTEHCAIKYYDRSNSKTGKHKFSMKLKCACCGCNYYRVNVKTGYGETHTQWKCGRHMHTGLKETHSKDGCTNIIINEETLMNLLKDNFNNMFTSLFSNIDGIIDKVLKNIREVFNEDNTKIELKKLQAELNKQNNKKSVLFNKLMDGVIGDNDFKMFNEELSANIDSLTEKIEVLKNRSTTYNDYETRLIEIRRSIKASSIIEKVTTEELIKCIDTISVKPTGKCNVTFNKTNLFNLLDIYYEDMLDEHINKYINFEFKYFRLNRYEQHRDKVDKAVLREFSNNPKLTIQGVADLIGEKYSYVYTSIAKLRKEGKLSYKQLNFEHDGLWIVNS